MIERAEECGFVLLYCTAITIDIEQFRLTEQCLFLAIHAPPQLQCSLRGPVGDSSRHFGREP
jgi:hypothetical protein